MVDFGQVIILSKQSQSYSCEVGNIFPCMLARVLAVLSASRAFGFKPEQPAPLGPYPTPHVHEWNGEKSLGMRLVEGRLHMAAKKSKGNHIPDVAARTMFVNDDGSPMNFYMRPSEMKAKIRPMVEVSLMSFWIAGNDRWCSACKLGVGICRTEFSYHVNVYMTTRSGCNEISQFVGCGSRRIS